MKKRSIILLVVFMTISVVGIRIMQVRLRENDIKLRNQQFYYTINQVLYAVVSKAQNQEKDKYLKKFRDTDEKEGGDIYEYVYKKENKSTGEIFAYKHLILEKGVSLKFLDSEKKIDSIFGKMSVSKVKTNYYNNKNSTRKLDNPLLVDINGRYLEKTIEDIAVIEPVYKRVSLDSLQNWVADELAKRNINYKYELAILNDAIPTKVRTKHFKSDDSEFKYYKFRIFPVSSGLRKYELVLAFKKNELFRHESIRIQFLSDLLMLFILMIYVLTIYFIVRQKKLSLMKTDFINNMTHEFKTPIATINLITDAMKSPRVIKDEKQLMHYINMLKQENKRMLSQVENVLSLAVLDKIDSKMEKHPVDVEEVLEDAIQHVSLIVQNKNGFVQTDFRANNSMIMGDEVLLTNVFVNILDNAVKYSKEIPEIIVSAYNDVNGKLIVEISDNGIGMSKSVQKKIFDKFYRETSGNIHNVKGHGLGLSYVQNVVRSFDGKIKVKSLKNEGSTFFIVFPTIKESDN
jgi:two-component system phosphate regulon sensor histidine kinase PhoR